MKFDMVIIFILYMIAHNNIYNLKIKKVEEFKWAKHFLTLIWIWNYWTYFIFRLWVIIMTTSAIVYLLFLSLYKLISKGAKEKKKIKSFERKKWKFI